MDKVNQLIAKAMSTESDQEALACLRKAKKLMGGDKTYHHSDYSQATKENLVKIQNIAQRWKSECRVWHDLYYVARNQSDELRRQLTNIESKLESSRTAALFWGGMCLMLFITLLGVSL